MERTCILCVLAIVLCFEPLSAEDNEAVCGFTHNDCSYEIKLVPKGTCANRYDKVFMDSANQHHQFESDVGFGPGISMDKGIMDYSSKMNLMERAFSDVKVDHGKRLQDLEKAVRDLLGIDANSEEINLESRKRHFQNSDDKEVVSKLHEEFTKLRIELKNKNSEITEAELRLNETKIKLKEAQLNLIKNGQELLDSENKIALMERERMILRNQLKDKSYHLDVSGKKSTECENKTSTLQNQVFELFRSEATMKEDLETCLYEKKNAETELGEMISRHNHLKRRNHDMRNVLKIRENELIDCYNAKTQTFCGFEDPNICGFTQVNGTVEDDFDWTRGQGKTPSANTGPTKDHTCESDKGHFMYLEASARGKGNKAILYSPLYRGLTEQCVEFYYHMNGRHIGTLNVYARARGAELDSVWRAFGNQGDVWSFARLGIPKELARAGYQIVFEGITENGYAGDMSLDDVRVTDEACPVESGVTAVKVSVNATELIKAGRNFARTLRKNKLRRIPKRLRKGNEGNEDN